MHWRVLAVVVLAVTAGCGSVVGLGGEPAPETVTPAPVPTLSPTPEDPRMGIAPGLDARGVFDIEYLVSHHARALDGKRYVWEQRTHRTYLGSNESLTTSRSQRVVVENETTYLHNISSLDRYIDGQRRFLQNYEEYANGRALYTKWIQLDASETEYRRSSTPGTASRFATLPTGEFERHLPFENATVSRVDVGEQTHYLVRGTRSSMIEYGDVRNYSARAVIREDGLIRSLNVTFRATDPSGPIRVRYTSRYSELGTATVPPPSWLPTAREDVTSG